MIVKSFVINNGKLKVITLLTGKGFNLFYTDTEIKEAVKTLDVVSFEENKLTLKVNGEREIVCLSATEKKEPEKVETPKTEEKKEEIPVEEKVTFKKTVRPAKAKKAGK